MLVFMNFQAMIYKQLKTGLMKQTILTLMFLAFLQILNAQNNKITIGNQIWLKQNADIKIKGASYYNFNEQKYKKYGRLYTWQEAQNVCPSGWHLPTRDEFKLLLKEAKKASKNTFEYLINPDGFNALLSGFIFGSSSRSFGYKAYFWSATEMKGGGGSYVLELDKTKKKVRIMAAQNDFRYSVRCIKD